MTPQTQGSWDAWRTVSSARRAKIDLRETVICYGLGLGKVQGGILCRLLDGESDWRELARAVSAHRPAKMGAIHEAVSALNGRFGQVVVSSRPGGRITGNYSLTSLGRNLCAEAVENSERGLAKLKAEVKG